MLLSIIRTIIEMNKTNVIILACVHAYLLIYQTHRTNNVTLRQLQPY